MTSQGREETVRPRDSWIRWSLLGVAVAFVVWWFVTAHREPPQRPASEGFFAEAPDRSTGAPREGTRLVVRTVWHDEDFGWRFWEKYHFRYANFLRVWESWDESDPGESLSIQGLDRKERGLLEERFQATGDPALGRAVLERAEILSLPAGEPREVDSKATPWTRSLRVLYGREPDLFPWYRNPIHRTFSECRAADFVILERILALPGNPGR